MVVSQVLTFKEGNQYQVKFPTVGQMMDIEAFKMLYTKNKYVQYAMSELKSHVFLLDMTDAISYLSVLIPELQKDLGVKTWWDLDPLDAKKIVVVYKEQFLPWYLPYLKDLYKFESAEEQKKEDDANDQSKV